MKLVSKHLSVRSRVLGVMVAASAVAAGRATAAVVGPDGDVTYTTTWVDTNSAEDFLSKNIFFYNYNDGTNGGGVEGGLPNISPGVTSTDIGNPFQVSGINTFGQLGVYNVLDVNTNNYTSSVYVGYDATGAAAATGVPFETEFAGFFSQHTDLVPTEQTIVDALGNEDIYDNDTGNESGRVIYQFRDYVQEMDDTTAPVNGGLLTLVHFGNGTDFGAVSTADVAPGVPIPEPAGLSVLALAAVAIKRRRK